MLRFFSSPGIGVEITSKTLRVGVFTSKGSPSEAPTVKAVPLPAGMVGDGFAAPNIRDVDGLRTLLGDALGDFAVFKTRKIGLSLPDTVFRVQNLEFDELPKRTADRDRLVRWRIEKSAAFDAAHTVLRYQVLPRQDKGFSVLVSMAKQDVLGQYEDLLAGMGYDVWRVAPASFHALNFYYPSLKARDLQGFAFAWITESSYALHVAERGTLRFYRCKEIRPGSADTKLRVLRELEDSLHFYAHLDREQLSEIGHLFLAGDSPLLEPLADALAGALTTQAEVVGLQAAVPAAGGVPDAFSSVMGAGSLQ